MVNTQYRVEFKIEDWLESGKYTVQGWIEFKIEDRLESGKYAVQGSILDRRLIREW